MKVLFTTNIPSPYRVDFFNELGKYCDLTVLFEAKSAKDRNSKWHSDKFINFKGIFLKGKYCGSDDAFCPEIIKYLDRNRFDIIVIGLYSSPTGMLAIETLTARKIPFIMSSDGGMKKPDKGIKHKIKKHFIGAASAWLSTGAATTEYLTYYGAKEEKVYTYPFTSLWKKDILKEMLSYGEKKAYRVKTNIAEDNVILSVGQFIHRKGYDILLNACKYLDANTGVYIVGGTPTEEYIKLKNELNLANVHFVDFMSKDKLAEYYKAADVFVLPTREDIWGLVVNEAMSFGLPVVSTDRCVAGRELVKEGENGHIVPVENPILLAEGIKNALLNSRQFGQKSLAFIQDYTIEKMVELHIRVFESVENCDRPKQRHF